MCEYSFWARPTIRIVISSGYMYEGFLIEFSEDMIKLDRIEDIEIRHEIPLLWVEKLEILEK